VQGDITISAPIQATGMATCLRIFRNILSSAVASEGQDPKYNDASPVRKPSNPVQADSKASSSSSVRKRKRAESADNGGENDDAVREVRASSMTFLMGDIIGLEGFIRHRLEELTTKPLRAIVTGWVKKLEPKRRTNYGPYHEMLPTEAPPEATPLWWPRTVLYAEPTHLEKDSKNSSLCTMRCVLLTVLVLSTLAVDIMLQHRDTRTDQLKRQQPWTKRLQQVADAEVGLADPEHFSASKDSDFGTAMKERAEKELLPSFFKVMHSYERFVHRHHLWTYSDISKAPTGKPITWQSIPRPPLQTPHLKRPRTVQQRGPAAGDDSGEETEVDDTMVRLMTRKDLAQKLVTALLSVAEGATQKARAETARAMSVSSETSETVAEITFATPPMAIKQGLPPSATPNSETAEGQAQTTQSVPESTIMHAKFRLDQGTPQYDDSDVRRGSAMTTATQAAMFHLPGPYSHSPQQATDTEALSSAESFTRHDSSFSNSYETPSLAPYPSHTYNNDFGDITIFDQRYPSRQHEPIFSPPIAPQNLGQDLLYTSMDSVWTQYPPQTDQVFHGLPYDSNGTKD
jgi:hypothetical protein